MLPYDVFIGMVFDTVAKTSVLMSADRFRMTSLDSDFQFQLPDSVHHEWQHAVHYLVSWPPATHMGELD